MRRDPLVRGKCEIFKIAVRNSLTMALSIALVMAALLDAHSHALQGSSLPQSMDKLNRMLKSYQVLELDLDQISAEAKSEGHISIDIDNVQTELILRLKNLRSSDIQWTETTATGVVQESLPPISTYEGEIKGEPDSQVRLLVRPDFLIGFIRRGNDWIFVDPLSLYVPGAKRQQSVAYHEADIRPEYPGVCGTTLLQGIGEDLFGAGERMASKSNVKETTMKRFRVATDADYEFYQANGSSSNSVIEGVLNEVDGIYQSQLNLTLTVGFQHVFTTASQPYTTTNASDLLNQFTKEWSTNRSNVQRDVAHLYTMKDLDGSVVGIAWLGEVCNSSYGFGLSSGRSFMGKLSAHEIGHNFNALHDDQVNPAAAVCKGSGPIMCSSLQSQGPDEFSQRSKDDIGTYVATLTSCLTSMTTTSVTTAAATGVTSFSANLNATVDPNGISTSVRFQWGTTAAYGNLTPNQSAGSGNSDVPIAASMTGLAANTTYHYRAVANNSAGTFNGNDMVFTTAGIISTPRVTSIPASGVTSGGAVLNGTVNPNGVIATAFFQWGTTTGYGNTTPSQSAGSGTSNVALTAALAALSPNSSYHYRMVATNSAGPDYGNDVAFVTKPLGSGTRLLLLDGSVKPSSTAGNGGSVQAGYAIVESNSGGMPYGTAVFSLSKNGIVVSEAGVPASPPTTGARIFIESRANVAGKSDHENSGTININTGFAMVNQGDGTATITFRLRDSAGNNLALGQGTLAPNAHVAKFIDELHQMAPGFVLPSNFAGSPGLGSLEITSDQPLSIVALRLVENQRGDTLLTTTPLADLQRAAGIGPLYFPQMADGGGYQTSLILLNSSSVLETGTIRILDNSGAPLAVHRVGDSSGAASEFHYNIPPAGFYSVQTDGAPGEVKTGSVQVTPDAGSPAPVGAGVFSFTADGMRVTESGIPSTTPTTHARVYVDLSGGHNTGLAIAAPDGRPLHLTLSAFQSDGVTHAGSGSLDLSGNGHGASFANEFIQSLPDGFTGVLDISAPSPFVALTLRSLKNARGDFLITTFPVADFNQPAPAPVVFPQIVDGGDYRTQFILLNTSGTTSDTTLTLFGDNGGMFSLGKK
ncbi:MAG: M12 family metallo-peptidase [Terriglobia bacterium]